MWWNLHKFTLASHCLCFQEYSGDVEQSLRGMQALRIEKLCCLIPSRVSQSWCIETPFYVGFCMRGFPGGITPNHPFWYDFHCNIFFGCPHLWQPPYASICCLPHPRTSMHFLNFLPKHRTNLCLVSSREARQIHWELCCFQGCRIVLVLPAEEQQTFLGRTDCLIFYGWCNLCFML